MLQRNQQKLKLGNMATDLLIILLSSFFAWRLRFDVLDGQNNIDASSLALILLAVLWLFGSGADQAAALRLMFIVFLISCGIFVLGRVTRGITLVALPSGGPDMNKARKDLGDCLKKHSRFTLLIILLYALLYWLLSV